MFSIGKREGRASFSLEGIFWIVKNYVEWAIWMNKSKRPVAQ